MAAFDYALQWATHHLITHAKVSVLCHHKIVQTAYSTVCEIKTNNEIFFLKLTPNMLFLEPKLLSFLHQHGCRNIPKILARHDELQCFLMSSSGDESLRNLFKGKADVEMLKRGISNYTLIQRQLEDNTQMLLSLGLPDWRMDKFPSLYNKLLQKKDLLLEDGLSKKEIEKLHQLSPTCVKLCGDLSRYKIFETINHCDFHENNMLLNKKTGEINIIDWSETVITHPFLSLNGCLWNIVHFNDIKKYDSSYNELQSQCITPWLDLYNKEDLLKAFFIADKLNGIYAALGYEQLYIATEKQPISAQKEHQGSIAGCLRSFLNSL